MMNRRSLRVPFVSRKSRVQKNKKPIDPQLLRDVDAIAAPYRRAMTQLADVVDAAARAAAAQAGSLENFQTILTQDIIDALQASIPRVAAPATQQAFRAAVDALRGLPQGISVAMSFDKADPRAVAWARLRGSRLIAQITDEQMTAVRQIISNAIANGVTVPQAAMQIRDVVGLHDRWQRAVDNAFQRDYDRLVGEGVKPARATVLAHDKAQKYRLKLIRARALNIARTEVMAAQNYGTYLGWIEAGEKGLLNLSITKKEWAAGPSGWKGIDVCDVCAPLDGVTVPLTASFPNGLMTPPAHPSCRCRMILVPPEV